MYHPATTGIGVAERLPAKETKVRKMRIFHRLLQLSAPQGH
jgi:hypothetical protein